MAEKCSYCGEIGHSIQQCPEWKGKEVPLPMMPFPWKCLKCGQTFVTWTKVKPKCSECGSSEVEPTAPSEHSSPVTVEEMRHALIGMVHQLSLSFDHKKFIEPLFESVMYAAKTTMKDASERRVFIQDLAAALNRRAWLDSRLVETFEKYGYTYMEAASEHSSSFHVKYIDLTTGNTVEKDISDREQFDLYKLQGEGKISIIDIKPIK